MGATTTRYPTEVRERAVRMVTELQQDHGSQWAAIASVSSKLGCTAETLRRWYGRLSVMAGRARG